MGDSLCGYYYAAFFVLGILIMGGGFFGYINHPAEAGVATGVYIVFHLFDGVFATICQNDFKCKRLKVLQWQFCFALLGTLCIESSIMKSIFGAWAVLSFSHTVIAAIRLYCGDGLNSLGLTFGGINETRIDWENKIKQNIRKAPEFVTYCEVSEPKLIWKFWKTRKVIWREYKTFKYKHWIDLSQIDEVSIENIEKEQYIQKIEFDIQFDDEETEKSYQQHVQNLLDKLPEMCRNGEIKTKRMIELDGINIERGIVIKLSSTGLEKFLEEYPWLVVLFLPVGILSICRKIIDWLIVRMDIEPFLKKVTIRKVVSNKDIEVI
ncbi:uncharacterized protein [Clytia hemisphaerica]|uniref:uncharacterized protein n=1 Tax=Clytia hemisphaerica TaxID=252671 RepID=UPI0034D5B15F